MFGPPDSWLGLISDISFTTWIYTARGMLSLTRARPRERNPAAASIALRMLFRRYLRADVAQCMHAWMRGETPKGELNHRRPSVRHQRATPSIIPQLEYCAVLMMLIDHPELALEP